MATTNGKASGKTNGADGVGSNWRPIQKFGEMRPSPLDYSPEDCKTLVDEFNPHVASTMVLYAQIKKHHWLVRGPYWKEIHLLLDAYADDILEQADFFAERLTFFGGVPVTGLANFVAQSFIPEEKTEDLVDIRALLANDIASTRETLKRLRVTHEKLDDIKDYYDESEIEEYIGKREKFIHELHFLLEPDEMAAGTKDPHAEVLVADQEIAGEIQKPA